MAKEFTALSNSADFPWLQGYSFTIVRVPLLRAPRQSLSLAFQAFFRGKGHSPFKARGPGQPRLTISDGVRIKGDHLSIPGLGLVRLRHGGHSYPEGKPVKASMIHGRGTWYATVCYKVDLPLRAVPERLAAMGTVPVDRWPWSRACGQIGIYCDARRVATKCQLAA